MKSLTTPDFWQSYANLPSQIKQQAKKAYRLWINNTFHPSLHFKGEAQFVELLVNTNYVG